jgi:uncharacterized membrane protein (DUF2068 family)
VIRELISGQGSGAILLRNRRSTWKCALKFPAQTALLNVPIRGGFHEASVWRGFSAILLLLGSLLQLPIAFMTALSGVILRKQIGSGGIPGASTPMPSWMPGYMYALCGFLLALALWGILTTVGLFRLRRWARYSVLIIGGALALFGLFSLLGTLVLLAMPLPVASGVDASQVQATQTITRIAFGVVGLIDAITAAVGIFWLVYFNKKRVRELFASAAGEALQSRRPFPISLLAVFNLIGAASCLLMAFLPLPAVIFGLVLHGWQKAALYLVFAALQAAVGVGLWRLEEWGRKLALGFIAFGVVQAAVYLVRPALVLRYSAEVNQIMAPMPSPLPIEFQSMMYRTSFGLSALFCIAIAAVLVHYRAAFRQPIEPQQGSPAIAL